VIRPPPNLKSCGFASLRSRGIAPRGTWLIAARTLVQELKGCHDASDRAAAFRTILIGGKKVTFLEKSGFPVWTINSSDLHGLDALPEQHAQWLLRSPMVDSDAVCIWKPQKVCNDGIYLVYTRHMTTYSIYLVYIYLIYTCHMTTYVI
jgi:hypothetical protein